MALFVLSANFGPSLGSPIGEWIGENTHMGWRWIYWINVIIGGAFALGMCFVPETLPRIVIQRAVKNGREGRGDGERKGISDDDVVGSQKVNVLSEMRFVATMALRIMLTEPIVIFLGLYNGFAYGLLFLYLDGVFDVFTVNNGLSYVGASLTYLNFCVGKSKLSPSIRPKPSYGHRSTNTPNHRRNNNLPLRPHSNIPLQTRQKAPLRPRSPRSSLHHLPSNSLALPNLPPLVRIHLNRQHILLVPPHRRRCPRFRRSPPLALNAQLHHR